MNEFFCTAGHLGWAFFSLAVFTGVWWLLSDLVWRLTSVKIGRLTLAMLIGWIVGVGLVLLGYCLGNP